MVSVKNVGKDYKIDWSGDYFHEYLDIAKETKGLSFDPKKKSWFGDAFATNKFLNKASDYELIMIDPATEKQLDKDLNPKPETRFFRYKIKEEDLKLPPLKPYQIEDINAGLRQSRLAYFLEMGLGKSYISINVLDYHYSKGNLDKVLIICPSEGLYNYKREMVRFSNHFTEDTIEIANRTNRDPFSHTDTNVVIMTYRTFLMISDDHYKAKTGKSGRGVNYRTPTIDLSTWGTNRAIILDESHSIANPQSRQSKVIHLHKDYFEYRYIMTGTPTPNIFTQIYSQMKFLDQTIIPYSYQQWVAEVANVGNRFSKYAVNYVYKDKQEKEESRFASWIIRRKLKDEIDLPPLYMQKIYLELPEKQKQIYQELVKHTLKVLKEEDGRIIPKKVQQLFPYLSQALDDPILLKDKISPDSRILYQLVNKWKFTESAKYEAVESLLHKYIEEQDQKVVVFDYHPKILDELNKNFQKYDPLILHGEIKPPKGMQKDEYRDHLVELFKTSKKHKVFFVNAKMLTVAVNLTEIRRVIYYSRDYSYLTWSQTKARFHRNGQTESVIVNPFIYDKSLDVRLDKALEAKKDLDDTVFTDIQEYDSLDAQSWKKIFEGESVDI